MVVVGRPIPHRNFDGNIFLESVSKTEYVTKATAHTNFTDDTIANNMLKGGKWKHLFDTNDIEVDEVLRPISYSYALDDSIMDRMELYYTTKIGSNGNTKNVALDRDTMILEYKIRTHDDKNVPHRTINISDLQLQVRKCVGDFYEEDCSCDFIYMKESMIRVRAAIHDKHHWIPIKQKYFLVLDDAGDYGISETIEYYKNESLTIFNIEIIWQIPHSPYRNVLDLKIWMAFQAIAERRYFKKWCTTEPLDRTVRHTWEGTDLNHQMKNIIGRLRVALCNILKGGGTNDLVKENYGVKRKEIKIEKTIREIEKKHRQQR